MGQKSAAEVNQLSYFRKVQQRSARVIGGLSGLAEVSQNSNVSQIDPLIFADLS